MKNWMGKFIHNCIAHPAMCFLPKDLGERFHDWTIEQFWPPKHVITWDHKSDIIKINGIKTGREE